MTGALALWLCAHDYTDMDAPLKLNTLVQCLCDLGVLRNPRKLIWRALNRTRIPATFPVREAAKRALVVLAVCHPSNHWQGTVTAWIDANRPLLIAKRAIKG